MPAIQLKDVTTLYTL